MTVGICIKHVLENQQSASTPENQMVKVAAAQDGMSKRTIMRPTTLWMVSASSMTRAWMGTTAWTYLRTSAQKLIKDSNVGSNIDPETKPTAEKIVKKRYGC